MKFQKKLSEGILAEEKRRLEIAQREKERYDEMIGRQNNAKAKLPDLVHRREEITTQMQTLTVELTDIEEKIAQAEFLLQDNGTSGLSIIKRQFDDWKSAEYLASIYVENKLKDLVQ